MSEFRDVDIISHAIHSRLQLVRDRIRCDKDWNYKKPDYLIFINANHTILKEIQKSVKLTHLANVEHRHVVEASKMFMYTVNGPSDWVWQRADV